MENPTQVPSDDPSLKTENRISHKRLTYRRQKPTRLESLSILKPMNLPLGLWLDPPFLYSWPINTAHPEPSTDSPVSCYGCISQTAIPLLFPNKLDLSLVI